LSNQSFNTSQLLWSTVGNFKNFEGSYFQKRKTVFAGQDWFLINPLFNSHNRIAQSQSNVVRMSLKWRAPKSFYLCERDNFAMKQTQKEMIAAVIKEGRIAKGYTQKELADLSNISVRSIQRIENGDILPRAYTLKSLAKILDRPFESFVGQDSTMLVETSDTDSQKISHPTPVRPKTHLIILSVGCMLVLFFLSWAFIAQSPRFPETTFELLLFVAIAVLLATGVLFILWRKK